MIEEGFSKEVRKPKSVSIEGDLVVVGGGMSGVCAAITAAREGVKVILVQDRPVLGGNASSEVRMWILGATSHMGNNNRWSREGGVIDEILVENLYRNREGNTIIFDTLLLEKVIEEENITLLLNTAACDVAKSSENRIESVRAFCSQNSTMYTLSAPLFCDASGDGLIGFASGAAFRMGAESKEEFGELFAPEKSYGELLGHTIYFYSKDVGTPVDYVAPSFALQDITKLPKYRSINTKEHGARFWWVEYGGSLDTIHDSETIKWELWKIVYGIWNYIKNSGKFPDARNLTLEWVGTIPGKRESRRFEGDYILKQSDLVERRVFDDAVSYGGWAIDLHPEDAIYKDLPSCNQWHSKGAYQIPYRCFYSRNIENLFLTGRIISASHVAFGSTRVMATCAHGGQVVGMAAAHCVAGGLHPRDLLESARMKSLQTALNREGQAIPGVPMEETENLVSSARIEASSCDRLDTIPFDGGPWYSLEHAAAQLLPLKRGVAYQFEIEVESESETTLEVRLSTSLDSRNYTPDRLIESLAKPLQVGVQKVICTFSGSLEENHYAQLSFHANASVRIRLSNRLQSGTISVFNVGNKAVSNNGAQNPPEGIGFESFEFWRPLRRPDGQNIAMNIVPAIEPYHPGLLKNGSTRPFSSGNCWVASLEDSHPEVHVKWDEQVSVKSVYLYFDTDFDHPLENSQLGHPERELPFCVSDYSLHDAEGREVYRKSGNHQTINRIVFDEAVETSELTLKLEHPMENVPASLFEIRCYGE